MLALLAGDSHRPTRIAEQTNKALFTFGRRTSLERVLEAADDAQAFSCIIVVGSPRLDAAIVAGRLTTPVRRVDQGESFVENVRRAFAAAGLPPAERLFLAAADIPLVAPHELARFATLVEGSPADVCIALARPLQSAKNRPLLPHYRRSMLIAKGGPYLTGNLFALRGRVLEFESLIGWARRIRHQSRPANIVWALARLAYVAPVTGFPTLLRLAIARELWLRDDVYERIPAIAPDLGRISREIMALVDNRVSLEFVDVGADGACFDIDNVEQYEAIEALLSAGAPEQRLSRLPP